MTATATKQRARWTVTRYMAEISIHGRDVKSRTSCSVHGKTMAECETLAAHRVDEIIRSRAAVGMDSGEPWIQYSRTETTYYH